MLFWKPDFWDNSCIFPRKIHEFLFVTIIWYAEYNGRKKGPQITQTTKLIKQQIVNVVEVNLLCVGSSVLFICQKRTKNTKQGLEESIVHVSLAIFVLFECMEILLVQTHMGVKYWVSCCDNWKDLLVCDCKS